LNKLSIYIPAESVFPAAVYDVEILNNRFLTDFNDQYLSPKPDREGKIKCQGPNESLEVTEFSTYGALDALAITDLHLQVNPLDYNDRPSVDWSQDLGAKSYRLYCQMMQWPATTVCNCDNTVCTTTGSQQHPYMVVYEGNIDGVTALDLTQLWRNREHGNDYQGPSGGDFIFVEDFGIKISYNCYVRGVNADGMEGPSSNILYIEDDVAPSVITNLDGIKGPSFQVCFSEPMNEALVQDVANWTWNANAFTGGTAPAITSINYGSYGPPWCATFYLGTGTASPVDGATVLATTPALKDVSGHSINTWSYAFPE